MSNWVKTGNHWQKYSGGSRILNTVTIAETGNYVTVTTVEMGEATNVSIDTNVLIDLLEQRGYKVSR